MKKVAASAGAAIPAAAFVRGACACATPQRQRAGHPIASCTAWRRAEARSGGPAPRRGAARANRSGVESALRDGARRARCCGCGRRGGGLSRRGLDARQRHEAWLRLRRRRPRGGRGRRDRGCAHAATEHARPEASGRLFVRLCGTLHPGAADACTTCTGAETPASFGAQRRRSGGACISFNAAPHRGIGMLRCAHSAAFCSMASCLRAISDSCSGLRAQCGSARSGP